MDFELIPIQQLKDLQVDELARLHKDVIHSLLSDLGLSFLQKYYRVAREDESIIGFCAVAEHGNVIGWVTGSPSPDQINEQLRKPLLLFVIQMLGVLFKQPRLIIQTLVSARTASLEMKPGQIELTYIGVASSARGLGVGEMLTKAFIQAAAGRYRSVVLSVEKENDSAIRLYTRLGFKIMDTFTEGTFKRHRMELSI